MLSSSTTLSMAMRTGGRRLCTSLRRVSYAVAAPTRSIHTSSSMFNKSSSGDVQTGDWYFYDQEEQEKDQRTTTRTRTTSTSNAVTSRETAFDFNHKHRLLQTGEEDHERNRRGGREADRETFKNNILAADDEAFPQQQQQQRRQLYKAAVALKQVAAEEILAEVRRDAEDGAAAVPPFAPGGWTVRHPAGSSYFIMTKEIPGSTRVSMDEREAFLLQTGPFSSSGVGTAGAAAAGLDDVTSGVGEMRFRSVQDDRMRQFQRRQQLHHRRQGEVQRAGDGETAAAAVPTFPLVKNRGQTVDKETRLAVVRSDIQVTLFAPFRVQDLSFHDAANDICEYATFEVLVRKSPPKSPAGGAPHPITDDAGGNAKAKDNTGLYHLLAGQRDVWDGETALFLRLASANSELRLRGVQFLSRPAARRVEETAFFGQGDPFFNALLARQMPVARRQAKRARLRQSRKRQTAATTTVDENEFSPPLSRFLSRVDESTAATDFAGGEHVGLDGVSASSPAMAILEGDFTLTGSVARDQFYAGPYITELSRELHEALLAYIMTDLGISDEVREYVCQMQYFVEQEEYTAWLARLQHLADGLQRFTPRL